MLTHGSASFFRANDCPLKHVHGLNSGMGEGEGDN